MSSATPIVTLAGQAVCDEWLFALIGAAVAILLGSITVYLFFYQAPTSTSDEDALADSGLVQIYDLDPAYAFNSKGQTDHKVLFEKLRYMGKLKEKDCGHWDYCGCGPDKWAGRTAKFDVNSSSMLKPQGNGTEQSPIDIISAEAKEARSQKLQFHYGMCHKAAIYNTGHGIMILPALDADFHINVNGVAFKLLQFHFHLPSEGKIDGERFGLQMCMVHTRSNQPSSDIGGYDKYVKREDYKSEKDFLASLEAEKRNLWYRGLDLSVINVFFRVGKPSAFLAQFWNKMPMKGGEGTTLEPMNLTNDILPLRNQEFFKFMGSLTTPPNREGLDYHVCWNIQEASAEQIKKYADMLADCGHPNGNSRPIQPTCGREIRLIKSTESALKRMTTGTMGVSRLKRFQSVAAYN